MQQAERKKQANKLMLFKLEKKRNKTALWRHNELFDSSRKVQRIFRVDVSCPWM